MTKLRINYSYYNNYELLKQVIDYYEPYKDVFDFSIIDDGSQIEPLTKEILPDWIRGYRITEDLGWGNEVCKNILMRETANEWNALMDLDYVIDLEDETTYNLLTKVIPENLDDLKFLKICFQFEHGARVLYDDWTKPDETRSGDINSFIVSRTAFFRTYGYDSAFFWYYGNDVSFFKQLDHEAILGGSRVKKIANQAFPREEKPGDSSVYIPIRQFQLQLAKMGIYDASNFKWRTEKDRLNFAKPYPNVVAL